MCKCERTSRRTVCSCTFPHVQLAQTEIAECNVARVIKENVLRFQVAVDDVESMQTFQSTKQLSCVESRSVDVETLLFLQVVKQLASVDERQNQVELLGRLEREL